MKRRDVLKVAGLAVATMAVGAEASDESLIVNRLDMKPEDPAKPTDFELKHLPKITVKEKDASGYTMVEITVGQGGIIHPSTPDHWIDFISLYADDKLVGKSVLEADISRGAASFAVKLDNVKTLTSKAGCNLHGIWTSTVTL
ncbi:MAG TPA: desulfoferrodoxin family protein [Sulfurovum sp.]|uniref:desulfoferrodoxin family protein n=1 Tax=Sulfurovum sp. TaxID=1969726 RepID=UPI002F9423C6